MDRRNFLKASGALGLLPLIPASSKLAIAQPTGTPNGQFFVLMRAISGWDITLGLDPWTDATKPLETDMFVEYDPATLKTIVPGMKIGPAAEMLMNYPGEFSIINGVFQSQIDNGHGASLTYMSSGSTVAATPTLPVELARSTYEGDFGVLFNGNLEMGDRAVVTSTLNELEALPQRADLSSLLQALVSGGGSGYYFEALKKVVASSGSVKLFIKNLTDFALKDWTEGQVMAAAFMSDVASCAQFDLTTFNLDTHGNHAGNHLDQQTQMWNKVDEVLKIFKATPYGTSGETLFDRTTFMVISEFSRTPALNAAGGKDHNPMTNSVLLGGRGVVGGKVVGASKLVKASESADGASYHIAYPIDYATCEVQYTRTEQARMIFPENVIETVATIMNVDRNIFRSTPAGTLPLSVLIKT